MPTVESGGARLHWDSEGQGAPVLLIMGHIYSSDMWWPLLPELTRARRAIWFDNRGVGRSDTAPAADIARFAADALAVLDAAGVERAHVYGVSMGGCIAQELAVRHPERVRSLVLGCTAMEIEITPARLALTKLLYRLPRPLFRALMLGGSRAGAYGSAASSDMVARDREVLARLRFTMKGLLTQGLAVAAYRADPAALARLPMPVLVLHGDEDAVVPVRGGEALHAAIPHSRLRVFPGAGHNFLVAAPEASTAAVLDFLAEVDGSAA